MDSRFKVKQITKLYESCDKCGLPIINCICNIVPKIKTKSKILILSTEREFRRPSNTARLLKLVNPDSTEFFLWERTKSPEKLIEHINNNFFQTYILFPIDDDLQEKDFINMNLSNNWNIDHKQSKYEISYKTPAFILLDGTWKEAAKMFRRSEYLKNITKISLKPSYNSEYTLRKGASNGELCTVEAAIEILKLNGELENAKIIKDVFDLFMKSFKAGSNGVRVSPKSIKS
ncbi:tRNA-uridine aminocarboxypropyltransferase [Clostridium sp.]|uniref:tRNA-uridine aminocarboxypropyltransferase n=1 Tax=Clostridium sp. TaxID=1506 RepID=UPI0029031DD6|nr:tRNA-uridine aminocarboxypropyltransferase [Clostridium sp.]MDU7260975.1 tRNA-uridine aminocarboxypropyltransferase [Clostridium butyricum]MDU1070283.1 tRNA-uridine aminocarboxypropyltransferase [Clostridium sp.]MDU2677168.1 tRNA-uridine aminocarboxypropyltransferase [Clostridium sp.]MDU4211226.1 tRNA-uridine aminocarboxypropyltransferase [Clostridium sp.]MDU5174475.1 tRNA-uridine aminocarboxypropyltransferase [Clostridium sp.]